MADTQAALDKAQDGFRRATPAAKCSSIKDAAKFCGDDMALIDDADSTSCDGSVCQPGLGGDKDTCCVTGPSSSQCRCHNFHSALSHRNSAVFVALQRVTPLWLCTPFLVPSITVVKEEKSGKTEGLAKTKPSDMKPDQGGDSMMVRPAANVRPPMRR